MKTAVIIIFSIIFVYLIIISYMYLNQRKLMYLPSENNYLDDKISFEYEEIFIPVDEKINLRSWFIKKNPNNKTLLFFHGNAGNLSNRTYKLNEFAKLDLNILIFAWRGFSGNDGEPSEFNLYNDSKRVIKWLNSKGIKNNSIVLYGESLGTGVAVELATSNIFNSVILESPFTSMTNAAKNFYPWLPIKYLIKDKYESENKIGNVKIPILILHGQKDNIVPFSMGKKLFDLANEPKEFYSTEHDDHMMTFDAKLVEKIKIFISKH